MNKDAPRVEYHAKNIFFFFFLNPSQCQAVHEVQSAAYAKQYMQTTTPPQTRALYTIRHRIGQQGTKDKGTTGDKKTEGHGTAGAQTQKGQQGTKDRKTTGDKRQRDKLLFSPFFFEFQNPSQCQAVHEVQGAAYTVQVGSTGSLGQTTAPPAPRQIRAILSMRTERQPATP